MERLRDQWREQAARELVKLIENPIGKEAILHCPWKTGNLAASWTVEDPIITNDNISVKFGFGVDYGVYVHKRTDLKHAPPTGPKFLENAVMSNMDKIPDMAVLTMDYVLEVE